MEDDSLEPLGGGPGERATLVASLETPLARGGSVGEWGVGVEIPKPEIRGGGAEQMAEGQQKELTLSPSRRLPTAQVDRDDDMSDGDEDQADGRGGVKGSDGDRTPPMDGEGEGDEDGEGQQRLEFGSDLGDLGDEAGEAGEDDLEEDPPDPQALVGLLDAAILASPKQPRQEIEASGGAGGLFHVERGSRGALSADKPSGNHNASGWAENKGTGNLNASGWAGAALGRRPGEAGAAGGGAGTARRDTPTERRETEGGGASVPGPPPNVEEVTDEINAKTLLFESRMEGGNLGRAVQVHVHEYDLYLMPDINSRAAHSGGNTQWYYFGVTNMEADVEYKFNIMNLLKPDSLYNSGMRPALFSTANAQRGVGWTRSGVRIAYYENHLETESAAPYYTLTFTITFPHANDVVYLAHCFPYGYGDLNALLTDLTSRPHSTRYLRMSTLCSTLVGNKCPLLTITNFASPLEEVERRRGVCVSARVHPGETCASWAMHGFLEFICGHSARARVLRDNFLFKVVPMLNPDGVISGQYRCSLSGTDLNRQWQTPCRFLHPTIHSCKQLLRLTKSARDVVFYCDIHGHSRKTNMFMYGCTSKSPATRLRERAFPYLLHNESLMFNYDDCNFKVQRSKDTCARVVAWKEFGISNAYTLEMSLGGGDFGEDPATQAPIHFTIEDYVDMGRLLAETLVDMYDPGRLRLDAALSELEQLHPDLKGDEGDPGEGEERIRKKKDSSGAKGKKVITGRSKLAGGAAGAAREPKASLPVAATKPKKAGMEGNKRPLAQVKK